VEYRYEHVKHVKDVQMCLLENDSIGAIWSDDAQHL
jgi:hypothetical protein